MKFARLVFAILVLATTNSLNADWVLHYGTELEPFIGAGGLQGALVRSGTVGFFLVESILPSQPFSVQDISFQLTRQNPIFNLSNPLANPSFPTNSATGSGNVFTFVNAGGNVFSTPNTSPIGPAGLRGIHFVKIGQIDIIPPYPAPPYTETWTLTNAVARINGNIVTPPQQSFGVFIPEPSSGFAIAGLLGAVGMVRRRRV